MTEEGLGVFISQAREECLEAERSFKGSTDPKYKTWWDFLNSADKDKTLGTLKAEYHLHEEAYKKWLAEREAARESFADRLHKINPDIIHFWNADCPVEADCEWGHNHGVKVDYGETDF